MNDPRCLKQALCGDRAALEELVGICYPAVFGYLAKRTGNRERAQELAQDTMVRVLESLHTFRPRPGAGFLPWVFRIAHNRMVDDLRRARPTSPLLDGEEAAGPDATAPAALAGLEAEGLRRALGQLKPEDRELLELRHCYGFAHREIAQVLGLPPPVVKSRLHAALERLRKHYAAMEGE